MAYHGAKLVVQSAQGSRKRFHTAMHDGRHRQRQARHTYAAARCVAADHLPAESSLLAANAWTAGTDPDAASITRSPIIGTTRP
jgi:adenosylmethionine-8-amino-7-oxononanoate aminotransferase